MGQIHVTLTRYRTLLQYCGLQTLVWLPACYRCRYTVVLRTLVVLERVLRTSNCNVFTPWSAAIISSFSITLQVQKYHVSVRDLDRHNKHQFNKPACLISAETKSVLEWLIRTARFPSTSIFVVLTHRTTTERLHRSLCCFLGRSDANIRRDSCGNALIE